MNRIKHIIFYSRKLRLFMLIYMTFQILSLSYAADLKSTRLSQGGQSKQLPIIKPISRTTPHKLSSLPPLTTVVNGRYTARGQGSNDLYVFTPLIELQEYLEELVSQIKAPHAAIVALQPHSGRILGIAGKSKTIPNITIHSGFPAASLFKVITAIAAVYDSKVTPETVVKFRGGNYTLNQYNYKPNPKHDRRAMSIAEAMGRSCNPVFGRLALGLSSPALLRDLTLLFRFDTGLPSDFPISKSYAVIPSSPYELSRTGAGFGKVGISPVHAATLMAAIANKGRFPTPHLIHQIIPTKGAPVTPNILPPQPVIEEPVALSLLKMMEATTTQGTAKDAFMSKAGKPLLPFRVAGKTGTLKGKNPNGLTKWFIAAAPLPDPRLAIAIVVIDPRYQQERPTFLGKAILRRFFS